MLRQPRILRQGAAVPQAFPERPPPRPRRRENDLLSYWSFLTFTATACPKETRDYVIKVFAPVIGENPRLFSFDFDNPLARLLKAGRAK